MKGHLVFTAAVYLASALEAALRMIKSSKLFEAQDFVIYEAMVLEEDDEDGIAAHMLRVADVYIMAIDVPRLRRRVDLDVN